MEDAYTIKITSALPFSEAQYNGLMQIVDKMDNCYNTLEIKIPNHAEFNDFMEVYLEWRGGCYHVELDFAMDEFGWKYPLVLAADLEGKRTERLLRELLVDVLDTGENEMVLNYFRQVPAERYGEEKPAVFERNGKADSGKEIENDCWTD